MSKMLVVWKSDPQADIFSVHKAMSAVSTTIDIPSVNYSSDEEGNT